MSVHSILYVSRSRLPSPLADEQATGIAHAAALRNSRLGITGALIFTGDYFAQLLEGNLQDITTMVETIGRDPRHDRMKVIDRTAISQRRFAGWGMAYQGPSRFVSRHITQLLGHLSKEQERRAIGWVQDLMVEFAKET